MPIRNSAKPAIIKKKPATTRAKPKTIRKNPANPNSKFTKLDDPERFFLKNEIAIRLRRMQNPSRIFNAMKADGIAISKKTVYAIADEIHQEWIEAKNESFDIHVARQIAKLDHIEETLWRMFEDSRREKIRKILEYQIKDEDETSDDDPEDGSKSEHSDQNPDIGSKSDVSDQNPTSKRILKSERIETETTIGELQVMKMILDVWDKKNRILGIHSTTINIQQNVQNNVVNNHVQPVSDKFAGTFVIQEDVRIDPAVIVEENEE